MIYETRLALMKFIRPLGTNFGWELRLTCPRFSVFHNIDDDSYIRDYGFN